MRSRSSHILHPIESLGVQKVSRGEIRIEKLSDRLEPKVAFPHRHNFFQITIVLNGKGWHEIDFKKYKVTSQALFFMKPGQVHSWNFKKGAKGFVIEFTLDSLSRVIGAPTRLQINSVADCVVTRDKMAWIEIESICKVMAREFSNKSTNYDLALEGFLTGMIVRFSRVGAASENVKTDSLVERFQNLVHDNYKKEHSVGYYARSLNVTAKALTIKVGRVLGRTALEVIQERTVLEAKRLLSYSDLSVAQVGYELGFEDANYFTRFFKKQMEISPTEFRKRTQSAAIVKKD